MSNEIYFFGFLRHKIINGEYEKDSVFDLVIMPDEIFKKDD